MATFTITDAKSITELTSKGGGDIYNINGGSLTIDCDSRYGLNQNTSAAMGSITVSATLGGSLNIDGRYVRLIPYSGGSGTIPALDSVVSQGSASGKLIGVWTSLTAAPTLFGTMPASGWIKIRDWNGVAFSAGALTLSGVTASATGADVVGWIDVVGCDASTIYANRLGTVTIQGLWYELGLTNGESNQTLQIPNSGLLCYVGGVFIEKSVGSNTFEFYANMGLGTTTGTEAERGKVVWVDENGLVRIGNSGSATDGYTPVSGLRVVIGNVILHNCTTAAKTANVIPNATIASRYDFTATGGGVIVMEKVTAAWYLSFVQAYSLTLTDVSAIDSIYCSECATFMTWTRVGVGVKATTELIVNPLNITLCFAGGLFTECVFGRVGATTANQSSVAMTDLDGFTFVDCTFRFLALRASTSTRALQATRVNNSVFTRPVVIDGMYYLITCTNVVVTDVTFMNHSGTTQTVNPLCGVLLASSCLRVTLSGFVLPIENNQPYLGLIQTTTAVTETKVRNIGTRTSPLDLGTVNGAAYVFILNTGSATYDFKAQRVYCKNTRGSLISADNSSKKILMENVYGDYTDASPTTCFDTLQKGIGGTPSLAAQSSVYGTHWIDCFTSTTGGRLCILMNEPSSDTEDYVTLANGAMFTSTGGLYMPTVGQSALFELQYYMIGHTGFQNSALVMAGGTVGNYRFMYQIDKNDGEGWSAESSQLTAAELGTALSGIADLDAEVGFKIRLKIETTTGNTEAITSVYLLTTSSEVAQDYQYPLDPVDTYYQLTGLDPNSYVLIYDGSYNFLYGSIEEPVGESGIWRYDYTHTGVDIENCHVLVWCVLKQLIMIDGVTLGSTAQSTPVFQLDDLVFTNELPPCIADIDFVNKVIILDSSGECNVRALYSLWKYLYALSLDTSISLGFAFSVVGGNVISGTKSIPCYVFLENGWKIRPQEADHTLNVTGGILVDDTGDPFVDTLGAYTVRINYEQPVQAIVVASSDVTPATLWDHAVEGTFTAKQILQLMSAVLAGKTTIVTGAGGSASVSFRDLNDTANRVVASMSGSNRSSVTKNV